MLKTTNYTHIYRPSNNRLHIINSKRSLYNQFHRKTIKPLSVSAHSCYRKMREQFVCVLFRPICVRLVVDSDFAQTTDGDERT